MPPANAIGTHTRLARRAPIGQGGHMQPGASSDASADRSFVVTHRMVLAIAAPMTLAYLTTPLVGIVDTAVVGQFGDAALIGGLAVGAVIFSTVFTAFNFLRMGTTGFVAQAYGAGDETEQQAIFWRAASIAAIAGVLLVLMTPLVLRLGLSATAPDPAVSAAAGEYVAIRMLSAPFALINYAILGLLLGQARALAGLVLQSLINGINIVLSIQFGLTMGFGVAGVAWATVIGETVVAIGALVWLWHGFDRTRSPGRARTFERTQFLRLMAVNRDIVIRSFALLAAFVVFTRIGAQFGTVTLAANAILLNFFFVAGHYLDGFAVAAEQIVGRAVGSRQGRPFWRAVRLTSLWGFGLAGMTTLVVLLAGPVFIDLMTTADDVRVAARTYLAWAAITAVAGVLAFQMDGVYVGMTLSVDMRNLMLVALAVFLVLASTLTPLYGNHALWLSFNLFLLLRGVSLLALLPVRARGVFAA